MGTPITEFDWSHYFHISTINKWLENLADTHSFIERVDLGDSYEGRPIRGLKLSKKAGNTAIFIEAGIHAREWISPATATYILNQLIHSTGMCICIYNVDKQIMLCSFNAFYSQTQMLLILQTTSTGIFSQLLIQMVTNTALIWTDCGVRIESLMVSTEELT